MTKPKRHLITSALPYANGPLHLGHLAGAYLSADIYVRYLRLMGKDVVWVCGSDEHGAAITIRAKKEGINPREIIDKYHNLNKSTFEKLGISFDIYHRTSDPLHHETALEFFQKLVKKGGEFDVIANEQYYDEEYDQFLADRYIKGTCPKCSHEEAYGDQCENCGSDLSPTELINPLSTLSGNKPSLRTTRHWYFKLDKHEEMLKEFIYNGMLDGKPHHDPKLWKNHVIGQCRSWLEEGLKPRAITRDLDWGISIPDLDESQKVLYVWFDAPIGYISATKQWAMDHSKDWEQYWKSEDVELIHFIGKDNIVFHCLVFPAMLKAYGDGYQLPTNVPANQFLNFEGQKFSKSKGWGIEMHEYLETFRDFPNKEDALRYALTRNMPENRDADFKWDEFIEFHDNEMVANLGNFVNRVVVLTNKYYNGTVPSAGIDTLASALPELKSLVQDYQDEIEQFNFRAACLKMMEISSMGNVYLQKVSPWSIWKEDPDSQEIKDCIHTCVQIVGLLSLLSHPFMPFSAKKIRTILRISDIQNGDLGKCLQNIGTIVVEGHTIGSPELLFAKINDKKDTSRIDLINAQKDKLQAILDAEKPQGIPLKSEITYEDFSKLDIRTGTIKSAEKVEKTDKLLKLEVDLGFEKRTIVSGIAEHFELDKMPGRRVLVVANLAPRKLRGIVSEGMILSAEDDEGKLCLVATEKEFGDGLCIS